MFTKTHGKILGIVVFWAFAAKCAVTLYIGLHDASHRASLCVGALGLTLWVWVAVRIAFFNKSKK
jgi:hypothetical protein